MRHEVRLVIVWLALAAIVALPAGCRDAEAQRRAEVQQQLAEVAQQLRQATVSATSAAGESGDEARSALRRVASTAGSISGGAPGQQAARSLIVAEALRALAAIDQSEAVVLEVAHAQERAVSHARLDAALRLAARAQGLDGVSIDRDRSALQDEQSRAEQQLQQASTRLGELDGPIETRTAEIRDDLVEVEQLDLQASELRRRATEQGPANGFEDFKRAVLAERQADRLRYDVAHREIEIGYELDPEHRLASARVQSARSMIDSVQTSLSDLDALVSRYQNDAETGRRAALELAAEIADTAAEIRTNILEVLDPLYDAAADDLQRAADQARQAAGKLDRQDNAVAHLTAARAHEARARLLATRADALADHADLLGRLAAAPALFSNAEQFRVQQREMNDRFEQIRAEARDAYASTIEILERVQARGAVATEIERFKQAIAAAAAVLEGRQLAPPPPADATAGTPGSSTPPATSGAGFPTPEALIEAIGAASAGGTDAQVQMIGAVHAASPGSRDLVAVMRDSLGPTQRFTEAMSSAFGEDALDQMGSGMGGGGGASLEGMSDLAIRDRSDDRVTVEYTAPGQPGPGTMDLVLVDGSWYIDGDTLAPMFTQMPDAARQQAVQMAKGMMPVMDDLVTRIEAGEFSSPQEVLQVMMQEMMKASGMPGGGFGGGAPQK